MKHYTLTYIINIAFLILIISCKHIPGAYEPIRQPDRDHNQMAPHTLNLPAWFVEKPQLSGVDLVYAYCSKYYYKDTEKNKLLFSAAKQVEKSKKVRIDILQISESTTGKYLGYTDIQELDVVVDENNLENHFTIIYKHPIGRGILALAAETVQVKNANILSINDTLYNVNVSSQPEWVTTPPSKEGYIFGVGCAQDHSSPEKAWEEAEKNARANIALQISANLYSNINEENGNWSEGAEINQLTCSTVELTNVSIIKHGYCNPRRTYYALARMKQN